MSLFFVQKECRYKETKVALQGTICTGTNRDVTKSFGENRAANIKLFRDHTNTVSF